MSNCDFNHSREVWFLVGRRKGLNVHQLDPAGLSVAQWCFAPKGDLAPGKSCSLTVLTSVPWGCAPALRSCARPSIPSDGKPPPKRGHVPRSLPLDPLVVAPIAATLALSP